MKPDADSPLRILLVDDNRFGLAARRLILEDAGYTTATAESGEDAWQLLQSNHFDVVVTDFRMGGMDGLKLIAMIRGSGSPARVVLLSGFVGCLGITPETSGADEVICKSDSEVRELLRAIKRLSGPPPRRGPDRLRPRKSSAARNAG